MKLPKQAYCDYTEDPVERAINDRIDPYNDRFSFGLTPFEVDRFRRILSRLNDQEVSMADAWGRAAECMGLMRTMMEVVAKNPDVRPLREEEMPGYQVRLRITNRAA